MAKDEVKNIIFTLTEDPELIEQKVMYEHFAKSLKIGIDAFMAQGLPYEHAYEMASNIMLEMLSGSGKEG